MKSDGHLLILGDSITLGVTEVLGDEILASVQTSYVQHLSQSLPGLRITIDAALHRTTSQVRQTIEATLERHKPEIVMLMIGGNDADLDWKRLILSEGRIARNRVSAERYAENLTALTGQILAMDAIPILTDFPRHDLIKRGNYISRLANKEIVPLLEQNGGQAESDRRLRSYRHALSSVARENSVALAAYGALLDIHDSSIVLGVDGAHPNDVGHELIARELIQAISKAMQPRRALVRELE
jgi:lysophospholipase L1-like esterase